MTGILPPMCVDCARLVDSPGKGLTCQAYPDGIPDEIVYGKWDHRLPKPGDRGLQFLPREDAEPREWWPDESAGGAGGREAPDRVLQLPDGEVGPGRGRRWKRKRKR